MSCTEPKPVCFNTKKLNCEDKSYIVLDELIKTFDATNSVGNKSVANCVSFDFALLTNIKIAEDEIAEMKSVDQTQQITELIASLKGANSKDDIIKIIDQIKNNNSKEIPNFTQKAYITKLKNKLEERWKKESNEFTNQLISVLTEGIKKLPEPKSPYDSYEELRTLLKTETFVDLIFDNLKDLNVDTFVKENSSSFDDMNKFIDLGKYALLKPHEVDAHAVAQVNEVLRLGTPTQEGGLNTATKLGRAGFIVLGNLLLKPIELVTRGLWAAFHYAGAMASGALIGGGFTSVLLTDINKKCREVVIEQVHEVSKVLFTNRDEYDEPSQKVKESLSKTIVALSHNKLNDIQQNLIMINDSIVEVKDNHNSWVRELVKKIIKDFYTDEDELYDNLLTELHDLIRTIKSNKGGKKKRTRRNTKHKSKTKRLKRRASIKRRASRGGRA
jgi:hypothetical protein